MADNIDDKVLAEIKQVTEKQREIFETQGKNSADFKNLEEKTQKLYDSFEKSNTEANEKLASAEKLNVELKERVEHLETLGAIGASSGKSGEEMKQDSNDVMNALLKGKGAWVGFIEDPKNEQKAASVMSAMSKSMYHDTNEAFQFAQLVKNYGEKASNDLLRSDIGEMGGFLCPPEWSSELSKNIIEYSPLRSFARVKTTGSKTYKEPMRIGIPTATWPGEAQSGSSSASNYTMEDWGPVRLTNTTAVTHDELAFNAYDLASELMADNAEAFAVAEGQAFFDGNGNERPMGWSIDPNVPEYTTDSSTVSFDDFIGITGELKRGYNAMFMFNRRTLADLRLIKDSDGRYLWNPSYGDAASGAPASINGYRYSSDFIEFEDLSGGTGAFPILFADMLRFYQIVDRADMTIIRDEYTRKKDGIVEFTWNKWTTGKPKIKEAGIRMVVGS